MELSCYIVDLIHDWKKKNAIAVYIVLVWFVYDTILYLLGGPFILQHLWGLLSQQYKRTINTSYYRCYNKQLYCTMGYFWRSFDLIFGYIAIKFCLGGFYCNCVEVLRIRDILYVILHLHLFTNPIYSSFSFSFRV